MIAEAPSQGRGGSHIPAAPLVIANLVPLAGALLWNWSVFQIVVLYWLENIIIGFLNVVKMLLSSPGPEFVRSIADTISRKNNAPATAEDESERATARNLLEQMAALPGLKLFLVPFFIVHYGMFCFVHGGFVFGLLGGGFSIDDPFSAMQRMIKQSVAASELWAALALAGSHLVYFFYEFIYKGGFRRTSAIHLMTEPYGRIVVLHLAILLGAFAILLLGSPAFLLILLILGKTGLELGLHRRSEQKKCRAGHDVV